MKRKERDDNDEGEAGSSSMDVSPQKKRIRFSEEVKVTTIPKSVLKMEKMEVGMGVEEEVAMVRDILGVAGAVEEISQKQEREDYEKEAREKSRELFKEELEEEEEDATRIDERAKVVPLGEANDRFVFFFFFWREKEERKEEGKNGRKRKKEGLLLSFDFCFVL